MKTEKLLLAGGILAGIAAGTLLGILLAPDKGSATRRKIVEKGEDMLDDLKEKMDELVTGVSERLNAVKEMSTCNCGAHCRSEKDEASTANSKTA